jgi:hypothetical protein
VVMVVFLFSLWLQTNARSAALKMFSLGYPATKSR